MAEVGVLTSTIRPTANNDRPACLSISLRLKCRIWLVYRPGQPRSPALAIGCPEHAANRYNRSG